jgi:hypothetical protein
MVISLRQRLAEFRDLLVSSARGDIALVIDIGRSVWPVAVDLPELELALINLVVNARDAMPDGGTIVITAKNTRLQPEDTPDAVRGEFVALTITDTGCGIADEILPKVFEPFFYDQTTEQGHWLGAVAGLRPHPPIGRHCNNRQQARERHCRDPLLAAQPPPAERARDHRRGYAAGRRKGLAGRG